MFNDPLRPPMRMEFTYIDDFALAEGSRFVTKAEYLANPPGGKLVTPVITRALADMATDDGQLLDFQQDRFYREHFPAAIEQEPDDPPLVYDTFTAGVLMESLFYLVSAGYLAHRGNGDSYDYQLALPAEVAA